MGYAAEVNFITLLTTWTDGYLAKPISRVMYCVCVRCFLSIIQAIPSVTNLLGMVSVATCEPAVAGDTFLTAKHTVAQICCLSVTYVMLLHTPPWSGNVYLHVGYM